MRAGRQVAVSNSPLSGPWTVKAEYLYVDLGKAGCSVACGFPVGANNNVSLTTNVVRAGINYRF